MKNEDFIEFMKRSANIWLENPATPLDKARYEGFLSTIEAFRPNARQFDSEQKIMVEAVLEFAKSSLRALLFVNTGGVFVIMTAIAAIITKESPYAYLLVPLAKEVLSFVVGIICAVGAVCFAYLGQRVFAGWGILRTGIVFNIISVLCGAASLVAFIVGALSLRDIFIITPC